MSGGCHFPCDCMRYQIGCGKCIAFQSNDENDFTHWNVQYRKRIYDKVKPILFCNTYMKKFFFDKSYLLAKAQVEVLPPSVDTNVFAPLDKQPLRSKYDIDSKLDFIIGFGSQILTDSRKGLSYIIEALQLMYDGLNNQERSKILLLAIGKRDNISADMFKFPLVTLRYIPFNQLSEFYSLSDVFICPSVNDAGSTMVGQSISCGTPVVGFEIGAMLDWVLNQGTGFCSPLKDSKGLANNLIKLVRMSDIERKTLSFHCREFALSHSIDKRSAYWISMFEKYL